MIFRLSVSSAVSTFFMTWLSTKGPFLSDRGNALPPLWRNYFLLLMISLSLTLRPRVLYPLVGTPHGVTGWRPPEDLPSPPPMGWSTGFMATPRTWGRLPCQRLRPALP